MRLNQRLQNLESMIGVDSCPICGQPGGTGAPVRFRILPHDAPDPEPCRACGRLPVRFTLNIDTPGSEAAL